MVVRQLDRMLQVPLMGGSDCQPWVLVVFALSPKNVIVWELAYGVKNGRRDLAPSLESVLPVGL